MAYPSEHATCADPQPRRDNKPEKRPQEFPVVDLPAPGNTRLKIAAMPGELNLFIIIPRMDNQSADSSASYKLKKFPRVAKQAALLIYYLLAPSIVVRSHNLTPPHRKPRRFGGPTRT